VAVNPRQLLEDLTMLAPNENSWLSELFFGLSPEGRAVVSLYLVEGESVRGVAETLDLSETQQSEVKKILERRQEQSNRILRDPSPSGVDRVGKFRALNQSTVAQIRAILSDQQKEKYNPLGQSGIPRTSPQPSVEDWLKASRAK